MSGDEARIIRAMKRISAEYRAHRAKTLRDESVFRLAEAFRAMADGKPVRAIGMLAEAGDLAMKANRLSP